MTIKEITVPENEMEILDWEASQDKYQIEVEAYIPDPETRFKIIKCYKARIVDVKSPRPRWMADPSLYVSEWTDWGQTSIDDAIDSLASEINKACIKGNKTKVLDFKENPLPYYLRHTYGYRPINDVPKSAEH